MPLLVYSLAEIKQGTGFDPQARFVQVSEQQIRVLETGPDVRRLLFDIGEWGIPRFNARIRKLLARLDGEGAGVQEGRTN